MLIHQPDTWACSAFVFSGLISSCRGAAGPLPVPAHLPGVAVGWTPHGLQKPVDAHPLHYFQLSAGKITIFLAFLFVYLLIFAVIFSYTHQQGPFLYSSSEYLVISLLHLFTSQVFYKDLWNKEMFLAVAPSLNWVGCWVCRHSFMFVWSCLQAALPHSSLHQT